MRKNLLDPKTTGILLLLLAMAFIAIPLASAAPAAEEDEDFALETVAPLAIVPAFTHMNETPVLNQHTRADIMQVIVSNPGITATRVQKELGLHNGVTQYHLRVLEKEGLIRSRKAGKFRRYFSLLVQATTLSEGEEAIVNCVREHPGITQAEIGREIGMSRQLVNYYVLKLMEKGEMAICRSPGNSGCFPARET